MSRHPIEALLRPPVELWSMWVALPPRRSPCRPLGFDDAAGCSLRCSGSADDTRADPGTAGLAGHPLPAQYAQTPHLPAAGKPDPSAGGNFWARAFAGPSNTPNGCAIRFARRSSTTCSQGRCIDGHAQGEVAWESTPMLQWLAGCYAESLVESLAPLPAVGGNRHCMRWNPTSSRSGWISANG